MELTFRLFETNDVFTICSWRYDPPYALYNFDYPPNQDDITYWLDPVNNLHAIDDEAGEMVAFCSFGPDGQVPGGDYSQDALDIGMGMRPDKTGRGVGADFAQMVIQYAKKAFAPTRLRVTIADYNRRARRVWEKNGFQFEERFVAQNTEREFVILSYML